MKTTKMLLLAILITGSLAITTAAMASSWAAYSGNADADCATLDSQTRSCAPEKDSSGKIKIKTCDNNSKSMACKCKKKSTIYDDVEIEEEQIDPKFCEEFFILE